MHKNIFILVLISSIACTLNAQNTSIHQEQNEYYKQFGDLNEALYDGVIVYLVTGNNSVIVPFPKNKWDKFRFSPSADNKMIAFLPNDKVALFTQSDFNEAAKELKTSGKSQYVFSMAEQKQTVESPDDISTLLAMADD